MDGEKSKEQELANTEELGGDTAQPSGVIVPGAVTPEEVVQMWWEIATFDPASVCEVVDGKLVARDFDQIPPRVRQKITKMRQTREGIVLEFADKIAALTTLSKNLGLLNDRISVEMNEFVLGVLREIAQKEPEVAKIISKRFKDLRDSQKQSAA